MGKFVARDRFLSINYFVARSGGRWWVENFSKDQHRKL